MNYETKMKKIKEHARRKPREEENERKDITETNSICIRRAKGKTNKYRKYLKHICLIVCHKYSMIHLFLLIFFQSTVFLQNLKSFSFLYG
jgi:hypothetical protein